MFIRHIYAWEAIDDKAISGHLVFHWTMGSLQVPVCLTDSVPFYLVLQHKGGARMGQEEGH